MAEDKKEKWISIMIVPEGGSGVKKWRITNRMFKRLRLLLGLVVVFLVIGAVSLLSVGVMYAKMKHYEQSNARLLTAMKNFDAVTARLDRFEAQEKLLREILGSNIDLPVAPEEAVASAPAAAVEPDNSRGPVSGNEIQQAIARREAEQRRRPDIWPVRPWQLSDRFTEARAGRPGHPGIDIVASKGSNVVAAADGRVISAEMDEQYGLVVVIDHENGWETRYGHNSLLLVSRNDRVRKGQPIAIYGGTNGLETGIHLHFEMLFREKSVDPLRYLPEIPALKIAQKQ